MPYDEWNPPHFDEWGNVYEVTDSGKIRPPMQIAPKEGTEGRAWPEYDTSQGHCGLCGRLGCGGSCIQGGA